MDLQSNIVLIGSDVIMLLRKQFIYIIVCAEIGCIIEPGQEKCVLCHMRTTKAQISLRIRAV